MAQKRTLQEIFRSLSTGQLRPLYAVVGEDAGLREVVIARIRRTLLGEESVGERQVVFGPPDPARPSSAPRLAEVMDEVRTASLFASRKLVLVRGAESLLGGGSKGAGVDEKGKGKGKKKAPPPAHAALQSLLKSPVPGTVLVLDLEKLDGRSALAKGLEKAGALIECPRLYSTRYGESEVSMASSMGAYLGELARGRKLELSAEAGRRLLELADGESARLAAELDKLVDYLGDLRRAVSLEDVEALAAPGSTGAMSLAREALAGRTSQALLAAERAFAQGLDHYGRTIWDERAAALAIVGAIGREMFTVERTVLGGGSYVHGGRGKPPPLHVIRAVEAAARRWKGAALERGYRRLLEAETALKESSGRDPRAIVEELVVALGGEAVPAGRS